MRRLIVILIIFLSISCNIISNITVKNKDNNNISYDTEIILPIFKLRDIHFIKILDSIISLIPDKYKDETIYINFGEISTTNNNTSYRFLCNDKAFFDISDFMMYKNVIEGVFIYKNLIVIIKNDQSFFYITEKKEIVKIKIGKKYFFSIVDVNLQNNIINYEYLNIYNHESIKK